MHTSGMNKIAPQSDEESDIDVNAITDEEFSEMMGDYDYDGPGIPIEEVFAELRQDLEQRLKRQGTKSDHAAG